MMVYYGALLVCYYKFLARVLARCRKWLWNACSKTTLFATLPPL